MDVSESEYLKKLGERIVKIRKQQNLRQIDLADAIGMEDSSLRRIERGRINSSILKLRQISNALNITLCEMLNFDEKSSNG